MPEDTLPSSPPPADGELSALIAAVCDGLATPADHARLEAILQDPEARRTFVAFTRLNADLRWRLRREPGESRGGRVDGGSAERRRPAAPGTAGGRDDGDRAVAFVALRASLRRLLLGAARAAALLFATALVVGSVVAVVSFLRIDAPDRSVSPSTQQSQDRIVAHITATDSARWRDARRTPDPRLGIARGTTLDLASGFVEVTFTNGARVVMNGPAILTVLNSTAVHVHRGSVSARYEQPEAETADADSARGDTVDPLFVVHTPSASVIDLGTEFGVRVADDGTSDVLVYDGLVEIEPHRSVAVTDAVRLAQGDARRVKTDGSVSTVDVGFGRSIVRSISDQAGAGRPPDWIEAEAETIYSDRFDGTAPLAGRRPSSGGDRGDAAWEAAGDGWEIADGHLRSSGKVGSASLPFVPEPGVVYRLSASVHSRGHRRGLSAIGFLPVSSAIEFWKNPGGYAWIAQRAFPDPFKGGNFASGRPSLLGRINDIDAKYGTHTRMVQLDTREPKWRAKFFVDGEEVAWFVFDQPPPIAFASLSFNTDRVSTFDDFRLAVWRPKPAPTTAPRP